MPPKTNAVATVPEAITSDALTALLQQSGMLSVSSSDFRRMKLDGGVLVTLDAQGDTEDMFPPKVTKGVAQPSVTVRIVEPPRYYNAFWLGSEKDDKGNPTRAFDPGRLGRGDLNKSFSKKYDDAADQQADKNPANELYDQIEAMTGKRGDFRADLKVQVLPEDGEFKGDEQVYTLTLSASSALDWRGTRRNPTGGTVQEENFIFQLAKMAAGKAIENGTDQSKEVLAAMEALRLGGVVADIYLLRDSNEDGSRNWTVIAFKPVHYEVPEAAPALTEGTSLPEDEVPF